MVRLLTLVLVLQTLLACNSFTECEQITKSEVMLLIDVTDSNVFYEIENDLSNNLNNFMINKGLGNISSCERFTISLVPITANEALDIATASIGIDRRGQSYQTERAQANPAPLVKTLRTELLKYRDFTADAALTSGSSIANVMVKAIAQSEPGTKTTVLIFSDMIENNNYLNMYKDIPAFDDFHVSELIDPLVLKAFEERKKSGLSAEVIVIQKSDKMVAVSHRERDVKKFWNGFFEQLGLPHVTFIDNLTNIK